MAMKLYFEHIFDKGVHKVTLKKFSGVLPRDRLPLEYTEDSKHPMCFTTDRYQKVVLNVYDPKIGTSFSYAVGDVIVLSRMNWIVKTVEDAGMRLYAINCAINKEKKEWEGKVEKFVF